MNPEVRKQNVLLVLGTAVLDANTSATEEVNIFDPTYLAHNLGINWGGMIPSI